MEAKAPQLTAWGWTIAGTLESRPVPSQRVTALGMGFTVDGIRSPPSLRRWVAGYARD